MSRKDVAYCGTIVLVLDHRRLIDSEDYAAAAQETICTAKEFGAHVLFKPMHDEDGSCCGAERWELTRIARVLGLSVS